jgi:hypothetical protein
MNRGQLAQHLMQVFQRWVIRNKDQQVRDTRAQNGRLRVRARITSGFLPQLGQVPFDNFHVQSFLKLDLHQINTGFGLGTLVFGL